MTTVSEWWMWVVFFFLITTVLIIDLFLLGGRKAHRVSMQEALTWSIVWFTLAILFNLVLWIYLLKINHPLAHEKSLEFFTGYLIVTTLILCIVLSLRKNKATKI